MPTECCSTVALGQYLRPCHCCTLYVWCCVPGRLLKGMDVPNALQLAAGGVVSRNQLLYLLDRYHSMCHIDPRTAWFSYCEQHGLWHTT